MLLGDFEREEGKTLNFLADLHNFPDEHRARLKAEHPRSRVACRECRYKYENLAFIKRNPTQVDSVEDMFSGEQAYCRQRG
mmetsp:Transcript_19274/g.52959  ORF Transcript_19274/g.52959 Transcript_19274/m.52959 type:complete len:81 (+) Transcript_19274:601-843(+)